MFESQIKFVLKFETITNKKAADLARKATSSLDPSENKQLFLRSSLAFTPLRNESPTLDISPLDLLLKILHDAKILAKSSQVVEKELLIQEKEKLYMELKQILARQPGPEVAEQLSIYQQTLKEKTKQMKGMSSELNMYEAQVKEYKYEIERLAKELQEVKKKFYMQKRKEQQAR